MPLPERIVLGPLHHFIRVPDCVLDYAILTSVASTVEWHLHFADSQLLAASVSGLFAQDKMQVAERPALGALREALQARRWPTLTEEHGQATPVQVKVVPRRCRAPTPTRPSAAPQLLGQEVRTVQGPRGATCDRAGGATDSQPPGFDGRAAQGGAWQYSSRQIEYLQSTRGSGD